MKLLTAKEVADKLGITPAVVYRRIKTEKLPKELPIIKQTGNTYLFDESDVNVVKEKYRACCI